MVEPEQYMLVLLDVFPLAHTQQRHAIKLRPQTIDDRDRLVEASLPHRPLLRHFSHTFLR